MTDKHAVDLNEVNRRQPDPRTHLIAGAGAGLISAFFLQPLDLLKTRLQQQQRSNQYFRTSIKKEVQKLTRYRDLWQGTLPSTLRTSIGAGLYFSVLSVARNYLAHFKSQENVHSNTSALPKLSGHENLIIGFVGRAVVGIITMPITVIKTRFESNTYKYNSMYEGFESIYLDGNKSNSKKGSYKNFFRGSFATLARDCPYAGLYVFFYEKCKNDIISKVPHYEVFDSKYLNYSSFVNSTSALLAASVSTTVTAPFDAIKTRLQLSLVSPRHSSLWSVTTELLGEKGGFRNLFSGLLLRLGRKGLSAMISWCIYEELIKSRSFISFSSR